MEKPRFSQRMGLQTVRSRLQVEEVDEALRNRLWNLLKVFFWDKVEWRSGMYPGRYLSENDEMQQLCQSLWHSFFKQPLDTLENDWERVLPELRRYFFGSAWFEAYDFIEFVSANYPRDTSRFMADANEVLERELSAYRFVDGLITRIIDQDEIASIEEATVAPLQGPRSHIRRALELLADRTDPDYRNSIKESISAVEAICRHLTGDTSATLSQALSSLKGDSRLHSALRGAFEKLYGYTSDESGIRHALLETPDVGFDEAKFMLVVCSAFVNFMNSRSGNS